jgi:ankyrin repeat protein
MLYFQVLGCSLKSRSLHNANINAFYRGKTPLMRALKYSSAAVRELLLSHRDLSRA